MTEVSTEKLKADAWDLSNEIQRATASLKLVIIELNSRGCGGGFLQHHSK